MRYKRRGGGSRYAGTMSWRLFWKNVRALCGLCVIILFIYFSFFLKQKKPICTSEKIAHCIRASSEMKSLKSGRWLGLWKRDEWGKPSYKVTSEGGIYISCASCEICMPSYRVTICYFRDTKTGLPQEGVKKRKECDVKEMKSRPRVEPRHYWFTGIKTQHFTVAVWTQKPLTPLLTHSQGSQWSQKIRIFILQIKLLSSCTKILRNKGTNFKSCQNWKKNVKKTLFI